MKLLRLKDGFGETQDQRVAEFFRELEPLKGKHVRFRGATEPNAFHCGYLKEFGDQTVTFWNGVSDVMGYQEWTYPYWEVMIAN